MGRRALGLAWTLFVGAGLALAPSAGADGRADPPAGSRPERTLLVVLDAVPFEVAREAIDEGSLPGLAAPVPLVSTFPSTTSVALPAIFERLGMGRSPGYEARFFDWTRGRRRGGGPASYFRIHFPWREFFDWRRPGPFANAVHALRPIRAGVREFERALAAFAGSDQPLFTIYLADTDTAGHLSGPAGLLAMVRNLGTALERTRRAEESRGRSFRAVLLSDHGLAGGRPLRNVLPPMKRRLIADGWRLSTRRLAGPRQVVLTPYGLVSSFEAYVEPGLETELAGTLAAVEGVDLCAAPRGDGWRIEAGGARIDFARDGSDGWRWSLSGDREGALPTLLDSVAPEGSMVSAQRLLKATARSPYPDPLVRIAEAFDGVDNPASVVCSLANGHLFGARGTERAARWTKGALQWTHGALGDEASLGFLAVDRWPAEPPAVLRYDQALAVALSPALLAARTSRPTALFTGPLR